jgi:hypothetical protein
VVAVTVAVAEIPHIAGAKLDRQVKHFGRGGIQPRGRFFVRTKCAKMTHL